ncbi:phosphatidate cytidylyltransferase [Tannockella kyphosi]|uniref:phosphatidate cytidylyltransferase n=1 Tax=Tannockella kyphosi TaxID=2899121 RepID=UPI0020134F6B|nr:phosphatidate cytidylyltransferase [Tannockella kyphosi]
MKQRIITAFILAVLVVPAVYFQGVPFQILTVLTIGMASYELLHICSKPKLKYYLYPVVFCFFGYCCYFEQNAIFISSLPILLYSVIIFGACIFDEELTVNRVGYIISVGVLIGCAFHILCIILFKFGIEYLLLVTIATYGSDVGAYFTGYFFGKNKLIPRLSPKKTVEGSIGGIVLGSALAILYGIYTGILNQYPLLITACVILTFTSQIGDLIFSAIKRRFDVKDYSQLLPGHGGVLDRLDSLLYNAIIMALFMLIAGVV